MSSAPARRAALKQDLNKAKTYEDACAAFGVDFVELGTMKVEDLLRAWGARKKALEASGEGEGVVETAGKGTVTVVEVPKEEEMKVVVK